MQYTTDVTFDINILKDWPKAITVPYRVSKYLKKIKSCNMGHDGADEDLYMKLIKEGFKDRNYHCSKNGKSSSEEDTTDLYDEYVDEINDLINDNKSLRLNKNNWNI